MSLSNPIVTCFVATILFLAYISDAVGASDDVVQAAHKEGRTLNLRIRRASMTFRLGSNISAIVYPSINA